LAGGRFFFGKGPGRQSRPIGAYRAQNSEAGVRAHEISKAQGENSAAEPPAGERCCGGLQARRRGLYPVMPVEKSARHTKRNWKSFFAAACPFTRSLLSELVRAVGHARDVPEEKCCGADRRRGHSNFPVKGWFRCAQRYMSGPVHGAHNWQFQEFWGRAVHARLNGNCLSFLFSGIFCLRGESRNAGPCWLPTSAAPEARVRGHGFCARAGNSRCFNSVFPRKRISESAGRSSSQPSWEENIHRTRNVLRHVLTIASGLVTQGIFADEALNQRAFLTSANHIKCRAPAAAKFLIHVAGYRRCRWLQCR